MHSFVYELARTPVRPDCYARAGNLPDWFYEQVCDYAENTDPPQREQAIADLSHFLGPLCTRKGDRLDFAPNLRDRDMSVFGPPLRCWLRPPTPFSAAVRKPRPSTWPCPA